MYCGNSVKVTKSKFTDRYYDDMNNRIWHIEITVQRVSVQCSVNLKLSMNSIFLSQTPCECFFVRLYKATLKCNWLMEHLRGKIDTYRKSGDDTKTFSSFATLRT